MFESWGRWPADLKTGPRIYSPFLYMKRKGCRVQVPGGRACADFRKVGPPAPRFEHQSPDLFSLFVKKKDGWWGWCRCSIQGAAGPPIRASSPDFPLFAYMKKRQGCWCRSLAAGPWPMFDSRGRWPIDLNHLLKKRKGCHVQLPSGGAGADVRIKGPLARRIEPVRNS